MANRRMPQGGYSRVLVRFGAELRAAIPDAARLARIKGAIEDGRFHVSPVVSGAGHDFLPADLYPDMLPDGAFAASIEGDELVVTLRGEHWLDTASFAAQESFRRCVDAGAPLLVSMCDPDFEPIEVTGAGAGPHAVGVLVPPGADDRGRGTGDDARHPNATRHQPSDPLVRALALVLTPPHDLGAAVEALPSAGQQRDGQLEGVVEAVTAALQHQPGRVRTVLDALGASMERLGDALRRVWLEGDVPWGGCELKVRAGEALGAWSNASGEDRESIVERLSSARWEHRMWAARAVRSSGWADAQALLSRLADDPYTDQDGFHLVREAAGFTE